MNVNDNIKVDPAYDRGKNDLFSVIGQSPRTLFIFFYENNKRFKMISEEDQLKCFEANLLYLNKTFNWTFGSFLSVLITDQIIMRKFYPQIRIPFFRLPLNIMKYVGIPILSFGICNYFFLTEVDNTFENMTRKYNFNYSDFCKVMEDHKEELTNELSKRKT